MRKMSTLNRKKAKNSLWQAKRVKPQTFLCLIEQSSYRRRERTAKLYGKRRGGLSGMTINGDMRSTIPLQLL